MHGRLWVVSQPGHGSAFHFTAPLSLAGAPPQAPPPIAALSGRQALVGVTGAAARRVLAAYLESFGMLVATVDKADALPFRLAAMRPAAGRPPLVVLDAAWRGLDGGALPLRSDGDRPAAPCPQVLLVPPGPSEPPTSDTATGAVCSLSQPVSRRELLGAALRAVDSEAADLGALGRAVGRAPVPPGGVRALRVLVVEDNLINQRVAIRLLERQGHSASPAGNGREALEALQGATFDVILMDLQMPVMDGFETTAEIRRREAAMGAHIPIVALTAHAFQSDRERCRAAGMDAFLAKPVDPAELASTLESLTAVEA